MHCLPHLSATNYNPLVAHLAYSALQKAGQIYQNCVQMRLAAPYLLEEDI